MIVIHDLRQLERPYHLVLAFLAGLSLAGGYSARCYIEALEKLLRDRAANGAAP